MIFSTRFMPKRSNNNRNPAGIIRHHIHDFNPRIMPAPCSISILIKPIEALNIKKQIIMQAKEMIISLIEIKKGDINCPNISILICLFLFVRSEAPIKVIQRSIILEKGSLHSMLFIRTLAGLKSNFVYKALSITFKKEKMTIRLNDRITKPRSRKSKNWNIYLNVNYLTALYQVYY